MKVIIISGHAQHGKDTVASMLSDELTERGDRVLITHFADLLKHICRAFFDWDGAKDKRGRAILQYVGTDVIRQKEPDFWVDFIGFILTHFGHNWDYVLIPDARFPNEVEKLKDCGFDTIHIRVHRPNFDNGLTEEQKKHPSETALDGVVADYDIQNESTLEDLRGIISEFVNTELTKKQEGNKYETQPG